MPLDTDTDGKPPCGPPGVVTAWVEGDWAGTEGAIVAPGGLAYVVSKTGLVSIDASGVDRSVASFGGGVGAAWWNDAIWVAVWEDDDGEDAPALLEVTPTGDVTRHDMPAVAKPNFLTPTPWGTLLIADDFDTRIFEWTGSGEPTVWASDVPSPNGMAFSPDAATLYVASTFTEPGLSGIAVSEGVAGERTVFTSFDSGTTPDGIAVAADGSVLVALNLAQRIDVWKDGEVSTLARDVPTVASLAFGYDGFGACEVVATSLFSGTVSRVSVGQPGFLPSW